MSRRDLFNDSTEHAAGELQYLLKKDVAVAAQSVPTVTAEQAMQESRVVQHQSVRDVTRVLFISQNTELLNPTTQTLDGYLDVSDVFDEVHILVLRQGIETRQPIIRPQKNVWIYTSASKRWWQVAREGRKMLQKELVFADGFRPDLIVARDPFESALVALWAAKTFNKPAQLHVLVNYFLPTFSRLASGNRIRKLIARYTVPKFASIRTGTSKIHDALTKRYEAAVEDIARLPQFNPYESIATQRQTLDFKEKYPQYVFNILYVGALSHDTTAIQAIDGARFMLLNPRISMILLGDGPSYQTCRTRVKLLGIEKQVIFERRRVDTVQYLKAAQLLLITDTDPASEELALKAAGAGIPMIMVTTEAREDMFTHLESAYIIPKIDSQIIADAINELMNNFVLRKQMSEQAFEIITQKFHQDPTQYRRQYRGSIEQALFTGESDEKETG
jgi:glycosyltransferase involved in cell wall biosynthesis